MAEADESISKGKDESGEAVPKINCGIIMPIATLGPRTEEWWRNIRSFIEEAIVEAGMNPIAVWEDSRNDVIHAKIVQNIEELPVVIGVIVNANPNVMLECGMRLWTGKPILFVSEQSEKIPFDVANIQCVQMPADCDYFKFTKLRHEISEKLKCIIGGEYRSFKSYFDLPAEVEAPKNVEKMDFNQFVNEIRGEFKSINGQLSECRSEIARLAEARDNAGFNYSASSCSSFGGCFPTGSTGSPMLSGDVMTSLTENVLKGECK